MTLALIGNDLILEGWSSKINVIWVATSTTSTGPACRTTSNAPWSPSSFSANEISVRTVLLTAWMTKHTTNMNRLHFIKCFHFRKWNRPNVSITSICQCQKGLISDHLEPLLLNHPLLLVLVTVESTICRQDPGCNIAVLHPVQYLLKFLRIFPQVHVGGTSHKINTEFMSGLEEHRKKLRLVQSAPSDLQSTQHMVVRESLKEHLEVFQTDEEGFCKLAG